MCNFTTIANFLYLSFYYLLTICKFIRLHYRYSYFSYKKKIFIHKCNFFDFIFALKCIKSKRYYNTTYLLHEKKINIDDHWLIVKFVCASIFITSRYVIIHNLYFDCNHFLKIRFMFGVFGCRIAK